MGNIFGSSMEYARSNLAFSAPHKIYLVSHFFLNLNSEHILVICWVLYVPLCEIKEVVAGVFLRTNITLYLNGIFEWNIYNLIYYLQSKCNISFMFRLSGLDNVTQ